MTFALGAIRSEHIRADQVVHFSAGKKGTNRVRQRTPSDVMPSDTLAYTGNLLGRPSICRRWHGAAGRTRLRTI